MNTLIAKISRVQRPAASQLPPNGWALKAGTTHVKMEWKQQWRTKGVDDAAAASVGSTAYNGPPLRPTITSSSLWNNNIFIFPLLPLPPPSRPQPWATITNVILILLGLWVCSSAPFLTSWFMDAPFPLNLWCWMPHLNLSHNKIISAKVHKERMGEGEQSDLWFASDISGCCWSTIVTTTVSSARTITKVPSHITRRPSRRCCKTLAALGNIVLW